MEFQTLFTGRLRFPGRIMAVGRDDYARILAAMSWLKKRLLYQLELANGQVEMKVAYLHGQQRFYSTPEEITRLGGALWIVSGRDTLVVVYREKPNLIHVSMFSGVDDDLHQTIVKTVTQDEGERQLWTGT